MPEKDINRLSEEMKEVKNRLGKVEACQAATENEVGNMKESVNKLNDKLDRMESRMEGITETLHQIEKELIEKMAPAIAITALVVPIITAVLTKYIK